MLRRVEVENFKGVGRRVELDLKPVTLLFGPNSAGKSTLLHALHLLHALIERGGQDVDTSRIAGVALNLGGFKSFVHGRNLHRAVSVAVEFETDPIEVARYLEDPFTDGSTGDGSGLPSGAGYGFGGGAAYGGGQPDGSGFGDGRAVAGEEGLGLDLNTSVKMMRVELVLKWSERLGRPIVTNYRVGVDGIALAEIQTSLTGTDTELINLVARHPILEGTNLHEWGTQPLEPWEATAMGYMPCLPGRGSAIPWSDRPLGLTWDWIEPDIGALRVEYLMRASVGMLATLLESFRYVGPIRLAPPRNYVPPTQRDEGRWANGMGAWDAMSRSAPLTESVSEWLSSPQRFDTDYELAHFVYHEIDSSSWDLVRYAAGRGGLDQRAVTPEFTQAPEQRRLRMLESSKGLMMEPCDLGEGISQVVPVIAAALHDSVWTVDGRSALAAHVCIEQPELHIHPRMQVVLGDLFLSQKEDRQFLVETHSEHLVLRLLRRIRETTDGELPPEGVAATVDDVAVLYVHQVDGAVRVKNLRIDPSGEFLDEWPEGFFDERFAELYG